MASERYARFYQPVLEALRSLGGSATPREVKRKVIEQVTLSQSELDRVHKKTGANAIENEIAWARNTLREAGLVDGSERGIWSLTQKGLETNLTLEEAQALRQRINAGRPKKAKKPKEVQKQAEELEFEDEQESPDETAGEDVVTVLQSLSPAGFERFCQRLLRESGFSEVNVTGRSGDGGIDGEGILQVNELVSFRVLFQCKRYVGSVPPKEIRDFRGAMAGRTDKGIFITTGTFSRDAEKEALRDGTAPIELVDGERLSTLLERLQLGVIPRTVFDVDRQFFDEFR